MGLSNIFKKLLFARQVKFEKGEIDISDARALILPAITVARLQRKLLEEDPANKKILRELGYQQGKDAVYFAHKLGKERDIVKSAIESSKLMGLGDLKIKKMNKEKCVAVIHCKNSFLGEFFSKVSRKDVFSRRDKEREEFKSEEPVDYFIEGLIEAVAQEVFEKDVRAKETKCIAVGDRYCEFVVKPKDKIEKED